MTNDREPTVIRIDLGNPTPVYRQIADALRAHLVTGVFQTGDPLPTVRQLAIDLAVNHNTVAEAYRLLAEEGWLELRRHHGAKVIARAPQAPQAATRADFTQRLRELAARAISSGLDARTVADQLTELAAKLKP